MSLLGGDVERGRKLFREKAEVQCLRCHKCEIGESLVGPDLTKIGAQKDRAYLLESIVFPSKRIAEGYQIVTLILKDSNVLAGRLVAEDANAVKLESMDEQGKSKIVSVPAPSIAQRVGAPSPMPENLRDFLTPSELRDLVEYLATRK
jgi:quinoprotein glucose dehydrogenase